MFVLESHLACHAMLHATVMKQHHQKCPRQSGIMVSFDASFMHNLKPDTDDHRTLQLAS